MGLFSDVSQEAKWRSKAIMTMTVEEIAQSTQRPML